MEGDGSPVIRPAGIHQAFDGSIVPGFLLFFGFVTSHHPSFHNLRAIKTYYITACFKCEYEAIRIPLSFSNKNNDTFNFDEISIS